MIRPVHFFVKPRKHEVLKIFKGQALEEMKSILFNSFYSIESREASNFSTPMIFDNKLPALIESKTGKGKVILFVSSIDRDWNNFSIQPTFLPWIQRWVKYSARGLDSLIHKELLVGEPFHRENKLKDAQIYIISPIEKITPLFFKNNKALFNNTYRPGVYQIFQGPSDSNLKEEISTLPQLPRGTENIGSFTVNIDLKESSSKKISDEEIKKLLPGARFTFSNGYQEYGADKHEGDIPMFTPLIILMGGMLLLEGWLVRKE